MILLLVTLWFMILFCACKGSKTKSAENEATKSATADTSNSGRALFKIRYTPKWTAQAQFAGFYMAKEKGYYRDAGLEVQFNAYISEERTLQDMREGKTDMSTMFLISALHCYSPENQFVNLAQFSQQSTMMLVGKKKRGITSIQSIKDKKVGLWVSEFKILAQNFFDRNKLKPKIIPLENNNILFINDAVDLINVMEYNEYHDLLMSGYDAQDLYIIKMKDQGYNIVEDGLYTSKDFFTKHPKECIAFAEASRDGWVYALNHPEETLEVVMKIMKAANIPANINHQRWMLDKLGESFLARPNNFGELDRSVFESTRALFSKYNPNIGKLKFEEFFPNVLAKRK